MKHPTDDEIALALCCGEKCAVGPNTGKRHRCDPAGEAGGACRRSWQGVRTMAKKAKKQTKYEWMSRPGSVGSAV